jgi:hypothetical protein
MVKEKLAKELLEFVENIHYSTGNVTETVGKANQTRRWLG